MWNIGPAMMFFPWGVRRGAGHARQSGQHRTACKIKGAAAAAAPQLRAGGREHREVGQQQRAAESRPEAVFGYLMMAIYRILQNMPLSPEDISRLVAAYEVT